MYDLLLVNGGKVGSRGYSNMVLDRFSLADKIIATYYSGRMYRN